MGSEGEPKLLRAATRCPPGQCPEVGAGGASIQPAGGRGCAHRDRGCRHPAAPAPRLPFRVPALEGARRWAAARVRCEPLLGRVAGRCMLWLHHPAGGACKPAASQPTMRFVAPRCHAGWVLPVRAGRCRRAGQGAAQLRAASGRASSHLAAVTESLCCTCSPSPGTPSRRSAVRWLLMQQGGCRAGTATPACVCHRPPSSLCPHAGAVATATHGSTMKHGSLSSQVVCVCVCVCVCVWWGWWGGLPMGWWG